MFSILYYSIVRNIVYREKCTAAHSVCIFINREEKNEGKSLLSLLCTVKNVTGVRRNGVLYTVGVCILRINHFSLPLHPPPPFLSRTEKFRQYIIQYYFYYNVTSNVYYNVCDILSRPFYVCIYKYTPDARISVLNLPRLAGSKHFKTRSFSRFI